MSSDIKAISASPPLPTLIKAQSEIEPTEIDLKIQRLEKKLADLRQQQPQSTKRSLPDDENGKPKKLKQETLLSPDNALLKVYPNLEQTFHPENVITFRVPQKNTLAAQFLIPAVALLDMTMFNQRFRHSLSDTSNGEVVLQRPDGSDYQLETMKYVFGRILKQETCLPLKDRPKAQVEAIFTEIWEFADGYYPDLLMDCQEYLTKMFNDFDDFLSYGTTVFEIDDPHIFKAWNNKLLEYFHKYTDKQEQIIHYLIKDLLPAYANDFEAYKRARQYVFNLFKSDQIRLVEYVITSVNPPATAHRIDHLFSLINTLITNGDIDLIKSLLENLKQSCRKEVRQFEPNEFPANSKGRFCKAFLCCFAGFEFHNDEGDSLLVSDLITPEEFEDEEVKKNVKKLCIYEFFENDAEITNDIQQLLQEDANDPLAVYLNLSEQIYGENLGDPATAARVKTLVNQALASFPTNLSLKRLKIAFCMKTQLEEEAASLLPEVLYFDPRKEFRSAIGFNVETLHFANYYFQQSQLNKAGQLLFGISEELLNQEEAALVLRILDRYHFGRPLITTDILLKQAQPPQGDKHASLMAGKYHFAKGQYQEAIQHFSRRHTESPTSLDMLYTLLEADIWLIRCAAHRYQSQIKQFNELKNKDPHGQTTHQLKQDLDGLSKNILSREASMSSTLAMLRQRVNSPNESSLLKTAIKALIPEALEKKEPVLQQLRNLELFYQVAHAESLAIQGQASNAVEVLKTVFPTNNPHLHLISAQIKYELGHLDEAHAHVTQALKTWPKDGQLLDLRKTINLHRGTVSGIATLAANHVRDFLQRIKKLPLD